MTFHIDFVDKGPSGRIPVEGLPRCPVCGAEAFVSRDVVDGFFMGFSAGCPRYCLFDGIHGHDFATPEEDHLTQTAFFTEEEAIAWWKERAARG